MLCLGCGALLARAAGTTIRAALLLPCGLAVVIVVSSLATALPATAQLATPIVVGLAVVGLCLLPRRRPGRDARTAVAVGAATFLLFGAPVLLSGAPTFAGYVKLDDTATFLAFADHTLQHGRDLSNLAPSSYEATLAVNVANGYPLGSILPLGIGASLVGSDPAWVWQPFISFAAALLAMTLYGLATELVPSRGLRAGVALVGAQSALLYGYALWGGVKEVVGAALLALSAATLVHADRGKVRGLLVPATAFAAFSGCLSLGGGIWLVLPGAALLIAPGSQRVRRAVVFGGLTALLALPALASAGAFFRQANVNSFRSASELGNLARPLRLQQVLGVWPTGDFRLDPQHSWVAAALVAIALAGFLLGVAAAVRRRSWPLLALAATAAIGTAIFVATSSPWVAGKALAIASPVALFLAACGYAALLARRRWKPVALVLGGLLVAGVAWSNVLAYHAVWLAPYDQLSELEHIGQRFAGQGPALMTEYQPYGVRHFLRRLDAEGASELRRRTVPLANGSFLQKGAFADIDAFLLSSLTRDYRLLVLRRSPVASRPPSAYELAFRGNWYDVWRRISDRTTDDHLALGGPLSQTAIAACGTVRTMAARAERDGALLVTPEATASVVAGLDDRLPHGWFSAGTGSGIVVPTGSGTTTITVNLHAAGTYAVWIGGSTRAHVDARVDGIRVGSTPPHINQSGMWIRLGAVGLRAGPHEVTLSLTSDLFRPGSGGSGFYLGPVALAQEPTGRLRTVAAADSASLCGASLDWLEATTRG